MKVWLRDAAGNDDNGSPRRLHDRIQNPTACPHTTTATATFDPSAIPEGAQTFRARTTD
ncbi:hypothetical protein [Baekduia alba]|uniref:hypothetical protein n=1 Tax=Baekduia alba TaxID=2997333 RepID=UPI002341BBEC|nr:hypothetical protein [Baekduia alba]